MLVDGTRQNSASNSHNHQQLPILRKKSSILNIFFNVRALTFCVVLSISCLSFSNAQPYKTNVNDINWARYVAPSPLEKGQVPYIEYGDDENSVEDGIIEEEPGKETQKNVPSTYEELDSILEDENEEQEPGTNGLRHQLQTKQLSSSPTFSLTRENVPPTSGKLEPSFMTSHQLQGFLSQFYLISTPYGYKFGRRNPALSTSFISSIFMKPPKARMRPHYDTDGLESIKSTRGLHTNFKFRNPIFNRNFHFTANSQPNFPLRLRRDPSYQLYPRLYRRDRNFQLRVRKRAGPSAFQLRVRKDADLESLRPNRNFQWRARKADQTFDDLGQEMSRIFRSLSRQAFQLRVRKAPSSSFQLRVRKDGSEDSSSHLDEEAYINSLDENELDHYAQSLPEIDLPGLLKLERKRKAGSFQLRV